VSIDPDVERRLAAMEARLQELEDDRAIRDVLARYGFTADTCNDEAYVQLYTEDGGINLTFPGQAEDGGSNVMIWQGKDQVRQFITQQGLHNQPGFHGRLMHVQGNNLVTHIDGDQAVANSYSIVLEGENGGVSLNSAGNNQWLFEKVDGRWLIKERRRRAIGDEGYMTNLDATPE
jgi:SnoaL-like domain